MSPKKQQDTTARALAVMADAVGLAEREMAALTKGKPDPKRTARAVAIGVQMGTLIGHIRRHEESQAAAGRTMTPAMVIAYLRGLPESQRDEIVAEVAGDDGDDDRSVLG